MPFTPPGGSTRLAHPTSVVLFQTTCVKWPDFELKSPLYCLISEYQEEMASAAEALAGVELPDQKRFSPCPALRPAWPAERPGDLVMEFRRSSAYRVSDELSFKGGTP